MRHFGIAIAGKPKDWRALQTKTAPKAAPNGALRIFSQLTTHAA
jgi:hypothetical protein